jgi:lantibiotic modifying enzyme
MIADAIAEDALRALANQAAFLHERLAGAWAADESLANRQAAQARLTRWAQLAAGGDWPRFARRLAWDGLDPERACPLLGDGELAGRNGLPIWADMLREALSQPPSQPGGWDAAMFVQPFVQVAQARLSHTSGEKLAWLSSLAGDQLTRHLAERLVALARPTLEHESATHPSGFSRLLAEIPGLPAASHPPDLRASCRAYPVLARQLATTATQWVDAIDEFLVRLAADWDSLAQNTGMAAPPAPGCIVDIHPGLSDSHRGGRTVWRVELHSGVCVAYKPKHLTPDRAWNDLLVWCNAHGLTPPLRSLWTLLRPGYGWMEWVEAAESHDQAERQLYYRRAGLLLGLLHLLHAADAHGENFISQATHPLLIDAEMLRYPQVAGQVADDPLDVLRTGLLPRWIVGEAATTEIGGLPAASASAFRKEIVTGYATLCHFVAAHWSALNAADGPLAGFQRGVVRFAPRPTAAYLRLLEHLRHPAFLRRGVDFSIEVDRLARAYAGDPHKERLAHLLTEEHAALNQGDLPIFSVAAGSDGAEISFIWPPFAPPTPIAQAQQARLIRESLDCSTWLEPLDDPAQPFLAHALRLGGLLAERAVALDGGGVGWIAIQFQPKSGLHQHALIGDDLYAGRAGIALFLAGLYLATGAACWRELALAALHPAGQRSDAGGRLYALAQISALLAAPELLAQMHLPDDGPPAWGVLDGQAGLLLGLLALSQRTAEAQQQSRLLERAVSCGVRLLAEADGWLHPPAGLGGIAHGAAGIGYALTRLYVANGDARFLAGARRAWEFQRSLYDAAQGGWQDRRGATPVYLDNWCNGAAGIGLAAVGCIESLPELGDVAERAAARLIAADSAPCLDTLCCGGFGQIDALLELGRRLKRPAWVGQALSQARHALDRAAAAGSFQLYDDLPDQRFNPAFFRGVAGIGYTLLRLAAVGGEIERTLPCSLSWSAE